MTIDATFWVMISFFLFVGLLIYFQIPQKIKATLEENISNIKNQIDEAYKLKEDAKNILTEHEKKISNSNLEKYFTCIIDSETVGVKKPNSKIFKYALNVSGAIETESLMIGDNLEADILGALDAGFKAIHFNNNHEPIHSHCQIITELKILNSIL